MADQQHPIDELFRQKLDALDVPYQDGFWQDAATLLDQRDKAARPLWKRLWHWLAGLGLLALAALGILLAADPVAPATAPRLPQASAATQSSSAPAQPAAEASISAPHQANTLSSAPTDHAGHPRQGEAPARNGASPKAHSLSFSGNANAQPAPNADVSTGQRADENADHQALSANASAATSHNIPNSSGGPTPPNLVRISSSGNANATQAANAQNPLGLDTHENFNLTYFSVNAEAAQLENIPNVDSEETGENANSPSLSGNARPAPQADRLGITLDGLLPIGLLTEATRPELQARSLEKSHFQSPYWEVGLLAQSSLSRGFLNGKAQRQAASLNSSFGLEFAYAFRYRWQLHLGAAVHSRGSLNSDTTLRGGYFDFDFYPETLVIVQKKLHYLELPVGVRWRVGGRHQIGLGASYHLLLDSRGEMHHSATDREGQHDLGIQAANGYRQGFADDDWSAQLSYELRLNPQLSLAARGSIGLRDITLDSHFHNQSPDRNINLRLGLKFHLR